MKWLAYGLLLILGVVTGVLVGAPGMVDRAIAKAELRLESALGVQLSYDTLEWTMAGAVTLTGVQVSSQGEELVAMQRAQLDGALRLLEGQLHVRALNVDGMRLSLKRDADGRTAWQPVVAQLRERFAGRSSGASAGAGEGGTAGRIVARFPEVEVNGLHIDVDTGPVPWPAGLEVPRQWSLSGGRFTAVNPALLKEDDHYELTWTFEDTTLDPGHGLTVRTHYKQAALSPKTTPLSLTFERPIRVMVGDRVLAAGGLDWDGTTVSVEDLALSVPIGRNKRLAEARWDEPVAPAVQIDAVKVAPEIGRAQALMAEGRGWTEVVLGAVPKVRIEKPRLTFERRHDGHTFQDLLPADIQGGGTAPDQAHRAIEPRGLLWDAAADAARRLTKGAGAGGAKVRGSVVRGYKRFEALVDAMPARVAALRRLPVAPDLEVVGGHFVWRDATRAADEPGASAKLENFDVTVSQRDAVVQIDAHFAAPGISEGNNSVSARVDRQTGATQVRAAFDKLGLWPYRQAMPEGVELATTSALVNTELTWLWSPDSGVARVQGKLGFEDGRVVLPPVASEPLDDLDGRLDMDIEVDTRADAITLTDTKLSLGHASDKLVTMAVNAELTRLGTVPQLSAVFRLQRARCQDIVDALPKGLIPMLEGLEVTGTFGWQLELSLDTGDMHSLDYKAYPELHAFKVVDMGYRVNLQAIQGAFIHRIQERDGTVHEMLVGPGAPGWVPLGRLSPYMVKGVTTTEDGSFFRHQGFAPWAIKDSLIANLDKGAFVRGASTITQQLVKNLFLSREKTISRKLQEMFITWQIERVLSKEHMLALYFNIIEWGPGIYGIRRAARHYFDKHPSELLLDEAVFLVSLIPSPRGYYFQFQRGEVTDSWQRHLRWIAKVMRDRGKISEAEFQQGQPYSPLFRGQDPDPNPWGADGWP